MTVRTPNGRSRRTLTSVADRPEATTGFCWARPPVVYPPTEPRADLWPANAGAEIRCDPVWRELLAAEGGTAVAMRIAAAEAERRRRHRDE